MLRSTWRHWLKSLVQPARRRPRRTGRTTCRPGCEALEDRRLLSAVRTLVYNQLTPFSYDLVGAAAFAPVLSRDGRQVVFETITSDHTAHIKEMPADGSGPAREIDTSNDSFSPGGLTLDVSADGSKVAYQEGNHTAGAPGIRFIDSGGPRDLLLINTGASNLATRLTADGSRVFFTLVGDGTVVGSNQHLERGLYSISPNGGGPQQLVTPEQLVPLLHVPDASAIDSFAGGNRRLDVSDDGSHVVFCVTFFDGTSDKQVVFGVNGDGSGLHQLSPVADLITNFGISGDGSKVFDVIKVRDDPTKPYDVSVENFDGSGRHVVDQYNVGVDEAPERWQMTTDGSRLLEQGFAHLVNADGSGGALDLRPNLGPLGSVFDVTMNADATRFAYVTGSDFLLALAVIDVNPAGTGAAPAVGDPRVTPSFDVPHTPVTVSAAVSAATPIQGVNASVLTNGVLDDLGAAGMNDAGNGVFTGQINQRPADTGTLLLRVAAHTLTADGLDHTAVVDANPTVVVPPRCSSGPPRPRPTRRRPPAW